MQVQTQVGTYAGNNRTSNDFGNKTCEQFIGVPVACDPLTRGLQ